MTSEYNYKIFGGNPSMIFYRINYIKRSKEIQDATGIFGTAFLNIFVNRLSSIEINVRELYLEKRSIKKPG